MDMSFIIPAKNEEKNIERCISSIKQFVPESRSYEIIVGDHQSSDATATIAKEAGAKVVNHAGGTVGALRNLLVSVSTGEVIVFLDGDVYLTNEWHQSIDQVLEMINSDLVTGSRCSPPDSENFIMKYWFSKMPVKDTSYIGTGHMIVSRKTFEKVGGFDPGLISGEDHEFCERAKKKGILVNVDSRLKAIHTDYPTTISAFVARERWHGVGDVQSIFRFLRSNVAVAAGVFIVLHVALVASILIRWDVALLLLVGIFIMLTAASLTKFPGLEPKGRLVNILLFYFYLSGRALSISSLFSKGNK